MLYNQERKEKFLNSYSNQDSRDAYSRILSKSYSTEISLHKDLCDFTKEELEDFLIDLTPLTVAISRSNGRIVTAYIDWCLENGYKKTVSNPLKVVDSEWFKRQIDETVKIYFTEKEISEIERFCVNAQDAVIIRLYFEGVAGKDSCEIRHLHKDDIDFSNNTLILRDENGNRYRSIDVEDKTINWIREALTEKTYFKKNGQMESSDTVREYNDLADNGYVLRNSLTKTTNLLNAVHSSVVYRRLKTISETLGIPFFTGKNILRSGVLYRAKNLIENGKFNYEKFTPIANRYGINNVYSVSDYCNEEVITKLYGKENKTLDHTV